MIEICRWTVSVVYGTTTNVAGAAIQNFRIGTSDSNSNLEALQVPTILVRSVYPQLK